MKKIAIVGICLIVVVAIVGLSLLGMYNGFVKNANAVDKSWNDVQSAYQRRFDTVPKFAEVAKFSTQFQIELQERYVKARKAVDTAGKSGDPNLLAKVADEEMSGLTIAIQVEAVPEAKVEQLTELNAGIDNAERVINHQRDAYNEQVRIYNNAIETIPGKWFAEGWGFLPKQGFSAQQEAQTSPGLGLIG